MILIWRNNWSGQIAEETAQCSTKLIQLNYSHLKILKLKINSLFLVTLFCALLAIPVFSFSLSLSMQNPQFLPLVSLKSSLNWPKIRNGLLFQNNQIVKSGNFVTGIKIFTQNNLIISILLIWYLPIVNLLLFLPVLIYSYP